MSRRKAPKNPLFEHYARMASLYRGRVSEFHRRAESYRGRHPENERIALDNAALVEEKALRYAQLAEKEKPVENPN